MVMLDCSWFQVKILMKEGEELEIPEFDDIYAQSEVNCMMFKINLDRNL